MGEADEVEVDGIGAVSSFTVITPIDYYGQEETEPYIRASILLDGTDSPMIGIDIRDIPIDEFRVGMRLHAVWREESERDIEAMGSGWGGRLGCRDRTMGADRRTRRRFPSAAAVHVLST